MKNMATNEFLLDTNVVIDFIDNSRPQHKVAQRIFSISLINSFTLYLPVLSIKDCYYILRRLKMTDFDIRKGLNTLIDFPCVLLAGMDEVDVRDALRSNEPDLEDGLIRAVAERLGVDAIISRDVDAFKNSPIPRISPAEALLAHGVTVATGDKPQY